MRRSKEIAKFACGAEAFHTFVHLYFWSSGATLKVFGFKQTPTVHLVAAGLNAAIAGLLGAYAWQRSELSLSKVSSDKSAVARAQTANAA
ncbi:hypothetical protein K2X30_13090 [bacterium]|nr:hypothetical protein [bacterium]